LVTIVALSGKLSAQYVGIMGLVVSPVFWCTGYISEQSFIMVVLSKKQLQKKVASN